MDHSHNPPRPVAKLRSKPAAVVFVPGTENARPIGFSAGLLARAARGMATPFNGAASPRV